MYCSSCGSQVNSVGTFCKHCGAKLSSEASEASDTSEKLPTKHQRWQRGEYTSNERWFMGVSMLLIVFVCGAVYTISTLDAQNETGGLWGAIDAISRVTGTGLQLAAILLIGIVSLLIVCAAAALKYILKR